MLGTNVANHGQDDNEEREGNRERGTRVPKRRTEAPGGLNMHTVYIGMNIMCRIFSEKEFL